MSITENEVRFMEKLIEDRIDLVADQRVRIRNIMIFNSR